jgi:hypothetical protein
VVVNDDIGISQALEAAYGDEAWIAGARANQINGWRRHG